MAQHKGRRLKCIQSSHLKGLFAYLRILGLRSKLLIKYTCRVPTAILCKHRVGCQAPPLCSLPCFTHWHLSERSLCTSLVQPFLWLSTKRSPLIARPHGVYVQWFHRTKIVNWLSAPLPPSHPGHNTGAAGRYVQSLPERGLLTYFDTQNLRNRVPMKHTSTV